MSTAASGEDLLVYVNEPDYIPVSVVISERLHKNVLREKYGGTGRKEYLINKNLQGLRRKQRGAVV